MIGLSCAALALMWMACVPSAQTRHHVHHVSSVHVRHATPLPPPAPTVEAPVQPVEESPVVAPDDVVAPEIAPRPVPTISVHRPTRKETRMNTVKDFFLGLSTLDLILLAIVAYYIYGHGLPWVVAKAKSIFGSASADVKALKSRVAAIEAALPAATKTASATITAAPPLPPSKDD